VLKGGGKRGKREEGCLRPGGIWDNRGDGGCASGELVVAETPGVATPKPSTEAREQEASQAGSLSLHHRGAMNPLRT